MLTMTRDRLLELAKLIDSAMLLALLAGPNSLASRLAIPVIATFWPILFTVVLAQATPSKQLHCFLSAVPARSS